MKTAIQELIEWVETRDIRVYQNKYAFKQGILTKLNQGLEKEKKQIEVAFSDGQETPINHPTLPHYSRDEYYNDNYNQYK
jgi:hypothetical protein